MRKKLITSVMCLAIGLNIGVSTKASAYINNGWKNTDSGWNYYANGHKATGWIFVNNTWYYMNNAGFMKTGWINANGSWYFLQESGAMKTGWLNDNGVWYYLNENGSMASNTTIDGYYVGRDGAWINSDAGNDETGDDSSLKDVTMKTEKNIYELGTKEVIINITNNGQKEVYYGLEYHVEKFDNNKWAKVPFKEEPMFIEIAYILESGKTNSQVIPLRNLKELNTGKYRVVKSNGDWTAEFAIK